jgi:hypothetical protein
MSTAQNVLNFKSPTLRTEFESKAQVVTKVDAIEDQGGVDTKPGARGNSKASKRAFLAQTPTCTRPVSTSAAPTQLQQFLTNTTAMFADVNPSAKPSPSQVLAMLEKVLPQLRDVLPQGPQKTALSGFLNSQAATQTSFNAVDPKNPPEKNSGNLFDYLTALMLFQVTTAKGQTNIAKMNQTTSDAAIQVSKEASVKAASDLTDFENQEASQKTTSFWGDLLGILGVALGALVFAVTGSPMLLVLAIVGIVTSQVKCSDGESIDQHVSDAVASAAMTIATACNGGYTPPTWLVNCCKDILFAGIAIGETIILGAGENALESISQDGAKAASVTAEAATATAKTAETVGANVVKGAETIGGNLAKDVQLIAENAANKAGTVATSVSRKLIGKLMLTLSTTGAFLPTVCQQIAQAAYPNDKDSQAYFAAALQLGIGLIGSFAGGAVSGTFQGPSFAEKLAGKFGENAVRNTKYLLKATQMLANGGGAAFDIMTGNTLLDEKATLQDQGDCRMIMALSEGIIQNLQTMDSQSSAAFKGVYAGLADMNQSVADRLDPWDPRNYAV